MLIKIQQDNTEEDKNTIRKIKYKHLFFKLCVVYKSVSKGFKQIHINWQQFSIYSKTHIRLKAKRVQPGDKL